MIVENNQKMEEFLHNGNELLNTIKDNQDASKVFIETANKLLKTLIFSTLGIVIAIVSEIVRVEVALANRPCYTEVLTKLQSYSVDKLRIANSERNYAIVSDSKTQMEIIKLNNENYLWLVEDIFKMESRGK